MAETGGGGDRGWRELSTTRAAPDDQGGRLAPKVRTLTVGGSSAVKKLFILTLLMLGGFAVWRKVQAQKADLDLWSEATTADDY